MIAYIAQYLPICLDSSFENLVLLYSKKYRTKHYDIFRAIKNTVVARKNDDELLTNVLVTVSDGYYYSISGDVYLQSEWSKLKDNLREAKIAKEEKQSLQPKTKKQKTKEVASTTKKDAVIKREEKDEALVKVSEKDIQKTSSNIKQDKVEKLESIKDCIKRIVGEAYGIYDEIFFKTVRISIRHVLEKSITQKMSLFGDEENKAEDSTYEYIKKNYENPYQDWLKSSNNKFVEGLGFKISSIEEILKDWAYYNKGISKN